MPEYLTPGVYGRRIRESAPNRSRVSPPAPPAFSARPSGGRLSQLVTSFPEYKRLFGAFFGDTKYLPYAVDGFFANGGKRCFVARNRRQGGRPPTAQVDLGSVRITAVGEGLWGTRVAFRVKKASVSSMDSVSRSTTGPGNARLTGRPAARCHRAPRPPGRSCACRLHATVGRLRRSRARRGLAQLRGETGGQWVVDAGRAQARPRDDRYASPGI